MNRYGRSKPVSLASSVPPHRAAWQSVPILDWETARETASRDDSKRRKGAALIERYTRPEMGAIWSERRKIDAWLAVEKAVCEGWNRRGTHP